jgi:hypothetical protein
MSVDAETCAQRRSANWPRNRVYRWPSGDCNRRRAAFILRLTRRRHLTRTVGRIGFPIQRTRVFATRSTVARHPIGRICGTELLRACKPPVETIIPVALRSGRTIARISPRGWTLGNRSVAPMHLILPRIRSPWTGHQVSVELPEPGRLRNRPPLMNIPFSQGTHHSIATRYVYSRDSLAILTVTSPRLTEPR